MMNILRVEQDGVEFFTVVTTGASGMSQSGIARLVDISHQSVGDLIENIIAGRTRSKFFKPFAGMDFILQAKVKINGKIVPVSIVPAHICAAIINYYAYISDYSTETAYYSSLKFAEMGIESWIHKITGWTPQMAVEITHEQVDRYIHDRLPKDQLAVAIHPGEIIKMLQQCGFSADGYRLYFYLEMMDLQNQTPTMETICSELNIKPTTCRRWLPRIHEWSHCADWLEAPQRKGKEFEIQTRMHEELGGKTEVYTPAGRIDLVTNTEVIEIKKVAKWKDAFGEVIIKGQTFPKHQKRIHLFGPSDKQLKTIQEYCEVLDVSVTFEQTQ